jgi:hypothetical protein
VLLLPLLLAVPLLALALTLLLLLLLLLFFLLVDGYALLGRLPPLLGWRLARLRGGLERAVGWRQLTMYIKAERGLTRQLLLEDGDERVRGAKVHVGDGLEDVTGGDLLAGAVDGLIVRAGVSGVMGGEG